MMDSEYEKEIKDQKKIRELNVKLDKLITYVKEKKKIEEEHDKLVRTNSTTTIPNLNKPATTKQSLNKSAI